LDEENYLIRKASIVAKRMALIFEARKDGKAGCAYVVWPGVKQQPALP